ncbi:hypothetical protein FRC12_023062 [Ceratobasidium sp. 428]|nr:hypothetical protein FRC12_023062 [Ceratobasidium sp. 428]
MSRKVIPMLKPHIHRVRSLDLESYAYSTNFVASVLNLWLNHGNPQTARSLFIHRPYFDGILSVDEPKPGTRISQSKKAKQVLLSVTTLHTSGSILPWDSSAYRDLVELKLQFHRCEASASESQLAALFSASPGLVTLRLASLLVTRTQEWSQPAPVLLSRLNILDLVDIEPESLELLLPLIAVPDSPDDLSVAVPFDSEPQTALEGFFARSRMTTLYCYHPYTYLAPRPSLLRSLPHVETVLILHQLLFDGNDNSTNSEPSRSPSTSLIPNVIVVSCKVTFEGLKDLVAMHHIQNLRLQRCELPDSIKDSQSLEDIHNSMLRTYPNLKLSIEDDDITWSHPIRTWDKYNW